MQVLKGGIIQDSVLGIRLEQLNKFCSGRRFLDLLFDFRIDQVGRCGRVALLELFMDHIPKFEVFFLQNGDGSLEVVGEVFLTET